MVVAKQMTYKDMTFCTYYKDCAVAGACHRPLTLAVRAQAEAWFNPGHVPGRDPEAAPIAVFARQPSCHVEIKT